MDKPKIEKGIPMIGETRGRAQQYPFHEMEIGDSIFIEGARQGASARACVNAYAKKSKAMKWNETIKDMAAVGRKQFASRKENGGVRIWRIEDRPFREDELSPPVEGSPYRWILE